MAHPPLRDLLFVSSKRALSDDAAVRSSRQTFPDNLFVAHPPPFKLDYVLADIPFLAVGILAFCTLTFLALMKRLGMYVCDLARYWIDVNHACSMLAILHLSVTAAFVASILDLSQILQRGRLDADLGLRLDSVQSLIKTREIGYALSNSLRFIFFWIFVAQPPKAERDTPNARAGTHSGNWDACGFVGRILQWVTLCLTLTIFALQVVWRLEKGSNEFTDSYTADSAIEVLLSAIFALKLLLNCVQCTIVPKWTCTLDYLGFIVSLLLSAGFGIANLIQRESLFKSTLTARLTRGK